MARSDAVQVILEVVARMRALDPRLRVTYEPGWETRGNGLSARYVGGIVHDTTTPSSPAKPFPTQNMLRVGRVDLSGPIANFGGPYCTVEAPWIHVVAAFPANHAGASGGRSMGPLPRTSLFNPTVLGLEIDFSGLTLMPAGQMYVGHLWARAVADVLAGGNPEYVRAHFETSITGKIDISYGAGKSYDMAAFRRDAAHLTAQEDDDMNPDQLFEAPLFTDNPGTPEARVIRVRDFFAELRDDQQAITDFLQNITGADLRLIVSMQRQQQEQITGLTAAVGTLAKALASGRDDLTADQLVEAVDQGIQRGGAAVLAAQEAARAAEDARLHPAV